MTATTNDVLRHRQEMVERGNELLATALQLHDRTKQLEAELAETRRARDQAVANAAMLCSQHEIARLLRLGRSHVSRIVSRASRKKTP